jgi:hypothetical protein
LANQTVVVLIVALKPSLIVTSSSIVRAITVLSTVGSSLASLDHLIYLMAAFWLLVRLVVLDATNPELSWLLDIEFEPGAYNCHSTS